MLPESSIPFSGLWDLAPIFPSYQDNRWPGHDGGKAPNAGSRVCQAHQSNDDSRESSHATRDPFADSGGLSRRRCGDRTSGHWQTRKKERKKRSRNPPPSIGHGDGPGPTCQERNTRPFSSPQLKKSFCSLANGILVCADRTTSLAICRIRGHGVDQGAQIDCTIGS